MKRTLPVLIVAALAILSACGGGSSGPQPISVTISTAPPSSLAVNKTAPVAARVSHDPANAGVTWSCAPAGVCGSFSASATPSGIDTTYTAPASIPASGSVTLTATSVSDASKSASVVVTIVPPISNATLKGQYAFLMTVPSFNVGITWLAGSVTLDGAGKITGGIQDYVAVAGFNLGDAILSGTYSVDANGHGAMTFHTSTGKNVTCGLAVTSTSHALIAEMDGKPATGFLDLQSAGPSFSSAQFSGPYSFTVSGEDQFLLHMLAVGGDFAADGVGQLNNGVFDLNIDGVTSSSFLSGSFTAPDSNGRGTLTFSSGLVMAYYIVTPGVVRLVETDGAILTGGTAYGQGSTANISTASLSGRFVFQHGGWGTSGQSVVIGQIFSNGAGSITSGLSDSSASGQPSTGIPVSGTYSLSNGPTGSLTLSGANFSGNIYLVDPKINILDPNNANGGGGFLLLNAGANIVGTGFMIPQAMPAVFTGSHAVSLNNPVPGSKPANEIALVGVLASDGVANFAGSVDYDGVGSVNPAPVLGAAMSGTFAADSSNPGHYAASFNFPGTGLAYPFTLGNSFSISIYQANSSQALVLETDTLGESWGTVEQVQVP